MSGILRNQLVLNARHCPTCNACWHAGQGCGCDLRPLEEVPPGIWVNADPDLLPPPSEPLVENAAGIGPDPDPDGPLLLPDTIEQVIYGRRVGRYEEPTANAADDEDDLLPPPPVLRW